MIKEVAQESEKMKDRERIEQLVIRLSKCTSLIGRYTKKPPAAHAPMEPNILDTLLVAFSFFKREPNYSYEAMQLIQVTAFLVVIPLIFSSALDQLLEGHKSDQIDQLTFFGGGVALMLLTYVIVLVYRKTRQVPEQIKPLRNYTREVMDGGVEPLLCREDVIEKVSLCWQSANRKMR